MEKLTLNDLISRKTQMKSETRVVDVPALGGSLNIQKLPLGRFLNILDRYQGNAESFSNKFDMCVDVVYNSVPMFQNQELQSAYDCIEPTDIVTKVFDDNIGAITSLADEISKMYGCVDELKN